MALTSKIRWHNNQTLTMTPLPPPPLKFTEDQWHLNNHLRYQHSQMEQKLETLLTNESKRLCELSTDIAKRNKEETDHRLKEKLTDIEYYKSELCRIRKNVLLEIDALSIYKERIISALSSIRKNALATCEKCLLDREQRLGIDLVHDSVDKELLNECEVIKGAERLLNQILEQTHEQMRRLKSTLYYIDHDLRDKEENVSIDHHNLILKETSSDLSFYTGTCQLDASPTSLNVWEIQTNKNILAAGKELQTARPLRCYIDTIIKQTVDDLRAQKEATDKALKDHIQDTKEMKLKLELEHSKVMQQASEVMHNIAHIKKAITEKERYMALAHTRLTARWQRPGAELTQDLPEKFLTKEIYDLQRVMSQLQETLNETETSLRYLLMTQVQIEEDINIKTNTLKIDEVQCTTLRHTINYHTF